jgi:hypothetical protein
MSQIDHDAVVKSGLLDLCPSASPVVLELKRGGRGQTAGAKKRLAHVVDSLDSIHTHPRPRQVPAQASCRNCPPLAMASPST